MTDTRNAVFEGNYIGLFSDGTIGVSDGVGYVDTMETDEVLELFQALKGVYAPNQPDAPATGPSRDDYVAAVNMFSKTSYRLGQHQAWCEALCRELDRSDPGNVVAQGVREQMAEQEETP